MLLIQLDPFNKSYAIIEIVIILAAAALVGYILSRLLMRSRLKQLKNEIEQKEMNLAACRSLPAQSSEANAKTFTAAATSIKHYPEPTATAEVREDLKVVEGIGPKIEEILYKNGIYNYATLASMPPVRIAAILRHAGPRFQIHDPTTWPHQAQLAQEGKWKELNELKIKLISGRLN
jgi:predicted flap endonuclease-1-like 5' DNA nuclease